MKTDQGNEVISSTASNFVTTELTTAQYLLPKLECLVAFRNITVHGDSVFVSDEFLSRGSRLGSSDSYYVERRPVA